MSSANSMSNFLHFCTISLKSIGSYWTWQELFTHRTLLTYHWPWDWKILLLSDTKKKTPSPPPFPQWWNRSNPNERLTWPCHASGGWSLTPYHGGPVLILGKFKWDCSGKCGSGTVFIFKVLWPFLSAWYH